MPSNKPDRFSVSQIPLNDLKDKLVWFASHVNTDDQLACAALLVAITDLRANEVLALTWADIEEGGEIEVKYKSTDDLALQPSKIRRRVQLPEYAQFALKSLRAAQGKRLGMHWKHLVIRDGAKTLAAPGVPIACTLKGERIRPRELSRWWRDHSGDYDLLGWNLADLRNAGRVLDASDMKVRW